jgi:hypothetical protein
MRKVCDVENLHAHPAVRADLRTVATAIETVIREKAEEQAAWLGELIAGMTELHQDTPEQSAAWRDGLPPALRDAWRHFQDEQCTIATALYGAWMQAEMAADDAGAPPAEPEVRAVLEDLHVAAHGMSVIDCQIVARDRHGNKVVIAEEVTTVEETGDPAHDRDRS